eukprot:CAMPEP_0201488156 /NCGR_PEP_ID=MMETSP0151_2-20130828/17317_1 /ASSEMBLY_ACC=CAM_ASM_000257 /TAXON_ID=200890 /ORGANISM="Paramoeba atlantica, Strain 621/1 / CCAP 1560/9" /LENGTH=253 /DNA_ID=CAMNT_0047873389 /DNA_START=126 /DNA_END=887 /DNA_ORIENTATION=+
MLDFQFAKISFASGTLKDSNQVAVDRGNTKFFMVDVAGFRTKEGFFGRLNELRVNAERNRLLPENLFYVYFLPADRIDFLDIVCIDFLFHNFGARTLVVWTSTSPLWDRHYFKELSEVLHTLNSDFITLLNEVFVNHMDFLHGFHELSAGTLDWKNPGKFLIFDVNPVYKSFCRNDPLPELLESAIEPICGLLSFSGQFERIFRNCLNEPIDPNCRGLKSDLYHNDIPLCAGCNMTRVKKRWDKKSRKKVPFK